MSRQFPMSQPSTCHYCGLPVPGGARSEKEPIFCCFGCRFAADITQSGGDEGRAIWILTRLGMAVFLTMGVMVFSLASYAQEFYGPDATPTELSSGWNTFIRYTLLAFAAPVFALLGIPILVDAWNQFARRVLATDALVVIGVLAALVYSTVATINEEGSVYFDTACMILVLVTLGRYLEASGKWKGTEAVGALARLMPGQVTVTRAKLTLTISVDQIAVDDRVSVKAGERIPADGVVLEGAAHVDEQIVSGESVAVEKQPGSEVYAGSLSIDGNLLIRATVDGAHGTVARLKQILEEARQSKGRFEQIGDRVAGVFIPIVLVLAIIAAWLGYRREGMDESIMAALSVLLISCPCAIGIATPLAIWVSLGAAATNGILFRSGLAIERLGAVRHVAFDKTGTLTTSRPVVESMSICRAESRAETISALRALSGHSSHLLAEAVHRFCEADPQLVPIEFERVKTIAGRGVVGDSPGRTLRLGSLTWMRELGIAVPTDLNATIDDAERDGLCITCFAAADRLVAVVTLSESLRPDAKATIEYLRRLGIRSTLLTGDLKTRGAAIGHALNIDMHARLSPEEKADLILSLRKHYGGVAMVGDGLNDAPALTAADSGVAMGCGADLTRESAAVCLLKDRLSGFVDALLIARQTVKTIKTNLICSFGYNLIGIALAVCGWLNPVVAAGLMVCSSLFVVGNSLRLRRLPSREIDL